MRTRAFKAALPYTIPICVGFLFLGISYGFLMRSKGFSFVYPMLMSFFIFAGSMESAVCLFPYTHGKCPPLILRDFYVGEI